MKFKTFLVGGAVRDSIMGRPYKDNDYVVLAPSFEAMKGDLLAQGCKIFVEKPEFLTIRCKHPTLGCVDFAVARKDGIYTDGRHPDSTCVASSLTEDLARRDFTCNAIALDVETGEILDPFDGQKHILNKVIRPVGDPRERLSEDKLRAFRALRFCVTKGMSIHFLLASAIRELKTEDFNNVSTERIREELLKMFISDSQFSFHLLNNEYSNLWGVIVKRGIWFRPTTEGR